MGAKFVVKTRSVGRFQTMFKVIMQLTPGSAFWSENRCHVTMLVGHFLRVDQGIIY